MEIAWHPSLVQRTHTAPVDGAAFRPSARNRATNMSDSHASPLVQSQGHTSSTHSIQSQPSSRSSDTTQGTAHSTLFPLPPPLPNASTAMANPTTGGNDVTATDNIMNSVADASSSLFQICVTLRQRLQGVPGFSESLLEDERKADEDDDPVTLLWRTLRRGYTLILLYNALRPEQPIQIPSDVREDKRGKAATIKFLQACIGDLKFPQDECFIIADLYGDDTTGFTKVTRVVNRVLDILVQRGMISDVRPTASDFEMAEKGMKRTQRQHIISELVTTERTYVQHLELLQAFKNLVEEKGIIPGDAVHDIFLNLNVLLDVQRRFLIRVEQVNALPEEEQNWGKLFVMYVDSFQVYEPYIANQKKCEKKVVAEYSKLREAGGSVEMRQMVESPTALYGFLMKPFQRLSKYPLLLEDLYKKGDLDEERKADLMTAKDAATSVLARTNHAVDREEKAEAVEELASRVDDWKGHRVLAFGELLLYGNFTVVKSEGTGSGKDDERQYHVYLFETILLCCKDIDLNKAKHKLSNRQLTDKRGKPKLQLKGRIFMQNVTDLVSLAKPGSYTCQIFWKGDPGIENFIIRFTTEEMMKKWAQNIEKQRRRYRERIRNSDTTNRYGTSAVEFEFMRIQPVIENPYVVEEEEEEDEVEAMVSGSNSYSHEMSQSRNGSQTSLRSRSTTGDSNVGNGQMSLPPGMVPAPRFPVGICPSQPPLSIRTRELQTAHSPGAQQPESYFSPTLESPMSSVRTSGSSNHYPFPRQQMPQNPYFEEGHGHTRFTAPAIARQRVPSTTPDGHPPAAAASRASARAVMHSAQQMPLTARNRSASSPDIHNGQRVGPASAIRGQSRNAQPPVPDVPATYQQNPHMIPRSQSNSPSLLNRVAPSRGPNHSPQSQRDKGYPLTQQTPSMQMQESLPTDYRLNLPPQHQNQHYQTSRNITPTPNARDAFSPAPPPPPPSSDTQAPTQLKVKVQCPSVSQTLTLVVPLNISYQSLRDRIDAKLQRSTNLSLGDRGPKENQVKLKYLDDNDFVSIQSDEDVQTAFETWAEQRGESVVGMGEIELFCQR